MVVVFPAPFTPEEREDLAGLDGEGEVVEHALRAERLSEADDLDGWLHGDPFCVLRKLFMTVTHCLQHIQT